MLEKIKQLLDRLFAPAAQPLPVRLDPVCKTAPRDPTGDLRSAPDLAIDLLIRGRDVLWVTPRHDRSELAKKCLVDTLVARHIYYTATPNRIEVANGCYVHFWTALPSNRIEGFGDFSAVFFEDTSSIPEDALYLIDRLARHSPAGELPIYMNVWS